MEDTVPVVLVGATSSGASAVVSAVASTAGALAAATPPGSFGDKSTSVNSPRAIQLSSTFLRAVSLGPSLQ
jgi:pyocin large subunit-like protein